MLDTRDLIDRILSGLESAIPESTVRRGYDGYRLERDALVIDLSAGACHIRDVGVALTITEPRALEKIGEWLERRCRNEAPVRRDLPQSIVGAPSLTFEQQEALFDEYLRPSYAHDEIFGAFCPVADHIAAPYQTVLDYMTDVASLAEWTLNIRQLEHVESGLFRGKMIFSVADAAAPATDIFIRVDVLRGAEHSLVCYPCAWDQGHDLWMRYFFVVADSQRTLGVPGTSVLWNNCKHAFYDRSTEPVPAYIAAGRERTDRPWTGEGWPIFHPLHRLELNNLKSILEHRHGTKAPS